MIKYSLHLFAYFILIVLQKQDFLLPSSIARKDRKLYRHAWYFDWRCHKEFYYFSFCAKTSASLAPVTVTLAIPSNGWILSARSSGSPLFLFKHLLAASHVPLLSHSAACHFVMFKDKPSMALWFRGICFAFDISINTPVLLFIYWKEIETEKRN